MQMTCPSKSRTKKFNDFENENRGANKILTTVNLFYK